MNASDELSRTAILTGASHGIGPTIARALAERDLNLVLAARTMPELERVAGELRQSGAQAIAVRTDLGEPGDLPALVARAEEEFGGVEVLINNAAIELQRRFDTLTAQEIEHVLRVDLLAPIELSRLVLPGMLERGSGHIINISSLAGRTGFPFTEAYAAAKDGLIAFGRVLRSDYRSRGVSASTIVLGAVNGAGIGQRTLDEFGLKTSTALTVTPNKIAQAVVRALEKDKAEIVVMPGPGRLLKALMDLFPGFGPAVTRLSGAEKLMGLVADQRASQAGAAAEEGALSAPNRHSAVTRRG
jgi:short-subunit dehydrogenase